MGCHEWDDASPEIGRGRVVVEKIADQASDAIAVLLESEVPGVEKVEIEVLEVAFV